MQPNPRDTPRLRLVAATSAADGAGAQHRPRPGAQPIRFHLPLPGGGTVAGEARVDVRPDGSWAILFETPWGPELVSGPADEPFGVALPRILTRLVAHGQAAYPIQDPTEQSQDDDRPIGSYGS